MSPLFLGALWMTCLMFTPMIFAMETTVGIARPEANSFVDATSTLVVAGTSTGAVIIEVTLSNANNSTMIPVRLDADSGSWEVLFSMQDVIPGPMSVVALAYSNSGEVVEDVHRFTFGGKVPVLSPSPSPSPVRPLSPLDPQVQTPLFPSATPSPGATWNNQNMWTPTGWNGEVIPVFIDGEILCYLRVPNAILTQRDLDYRAFLQRESARQGDITLYIDLYDTQRRNIHLLERPMTICIRQFGEISDVDCLGFFNEETGEWECQDKGLVYDEDTNMLCGQTDHLTQFSLLLTGGEGSSSEEYVVAWLSLGFAGGAILFFLAGALVVEMIRFKEAIRRRTVLAELRSLQLSANVL